MENSSTHSFRFDNQTWEDFNRLLNKFNEKHGLRKRVSGGQLIKGLIYMGFKVSTDEVMKLIEENTYQK